MKRRIISGILMALLVVGVLVAGYMWNPIVISAFLALLAGVATYEFVANAAKVESFVAKMVPAFYSAGMVIVLEYWMSGLYNIGYNKDAEYGEIFWAPIIAMGISALFVVLETVIILAKHSEFSLGKIASSVGMPLIIAFAFAMLSCIALADGALVLLSLLFIASCVCDMGAYFVGVSMGKHKLCSVISPNKTIEGAIGGIISSVVIASIVFTCFDMVSQLWLILPLTAVLCVVGMLGDLFASAIKRTVEIKDYGNLIPGHGGVLDRLDSVLFIAPFIFLLAICGVI